MVNLGAVTIATGAELDLGNYGDPAPSFALSSIANNGTITTNGNAIVTGDVDLGDYENSGTATFVGSVTASSLLNGYTGSLTITGNLDCTGTVFNDGGHVTVGGSMSAYWLDQFGWLAFSGQPDTLAEFSVGGNLTIGYILSSGDRGVLSVGGNASAQIMQVNNYDGPSKTYVGGSLSISQAINNINDAVYNGPFPAPEIYYGGILSAGAINNYSGNDVYPPPPPNTLIIQQFPVGLHIDSNNDGVIDSSDDPIRNDPTLPGKIIQVNDANDNNNLVPMNINFPDSSLSGNLTLSLASGADDVKVWATADKSGSPLLAPGTPQVSWAIGSEPSTVYVEAIKSSVSLADIQFTLGVSPSSAATTTTTVSAVRTTTSGVIRPAVGQRGDTGDIVPSSQGASGLKHYVSPEQANSNVVLTVTLATGAQFSNLYYWYGPQVGHPDSQHPQLYDVPRDNPGKYVVKLEEANNHAVVLDTIVVWVVWATIAHNPGRSSDNQPNNVYADPPTDTAASISTSEDIVVSIQPLQIFSDSDHPLLDGTFDARTNPVTDASWVAPPNVPETDVNVPNKNVSLATGAIHKWDVSQAVRAKVTNPNNIPLNGLARPDLWLDAQNYPSNPVVGNDDQNVKDEFLDPYSTNTLGKLEMHDLPGLTLKSDRGNIGDTLEVQWQFKDFARVLIGNNWYKISDDFLWRVDFKWIKVAPPPQPPPSSFHQDHFENNGSLRALDNNGW